MGRPTLLAPPFPHQSCRNVVTTISFAQYLLIPEITLIPPVAQGDFVLQYMAYLSFVRIQFFRSLNRYDFFSRIDI